MCGICGQFNFARNDSVEAATIRRMTDSITHRGPDDDGYFISGPIGLGFRRLSIIDLVGGHQPMSDREETVWLIFNGEIYNFTELRAELESRSYHFRTKSDTEVIVAGYKEWGTKVFDRLSGMFSLAIWDVAKNRLVLARDAMGIKPLYYKIDDGVLSFGSEIRAIVASATASPEVDPVALEMFLRFRYTPAPLTMFRGIRKLPPGGMILIEDGIVRESRWYNYKPRPFSPEKKDDEAREELLELYRGAVRRHLLSDAPVGILLSGGIDSALLLALMNEQGGPWNAYTVGYGQSYRDDELQDAIKTASVLGARHITLQLDQGEFEEALPTIVSSLEEPVATSSIVPMYFIAQRARQDVKVALIGQGPDELFGGYTRHLGVHYGKAWRGLPSPIQSLLRYGAQKLPRNETFRRGVNSLGVEDRLSRYQEVLSLSPAEDIRSLFRDGILTAQNGNGFVSYWHDLLPDMEQTDELGGLQFLEVRSSLPDELLMYADKLSMAHGLEARVPYLDRTVVEFAQRLPARFKVRNGKRKWLHKQVCRSYLPQQIIRRKKRGFAANVVDDWFRSSMKSHLSDLLLDEGSLLFGLLNPMRVRALLERHRSGYEDNHKLLFSLVMSEQWMRGIRGQQQSMLVSPLA